MKATGVGSRCPARRAWLAGALAVVCLAGPAAAVKRRAFVTSIAGTGNLATWPGATGATALDKADSICRALAAAATPPLPNAGTYRAWLSTFDTDAWCHVQGLTGQKAWDCDNLPQTGGGPWYLPDGVTPFLDSLARAVAPSGVVYGGVPRTESNQPLPPDWASRRYWTGTGTTGTFLEGTCGDWTSAAAADTAEMGDAVAGAMDWTAAGIEECDLPMRLLCLEPGTSEPVPPRWTPGAIVFETSASGTGDLGSWPEAEGMISVNAGYRICRHLATAAHLPAPASFVPWLSTPLADAVDRLTTDGPFVRVDGFVVANSVADLTDGALARGIYVHEDGSYQTINAGHVAWTGTAVDGTAAANHCSLWMDGTAGLLGAMGISSYPTSYWTNRNSYLCNVTGSLYCISNAITIFWDGFDLTHDTSRWSSTVH